MLKLMQKVAVLAGNQFNPSIFQQIWMLENGLLRREEFGSESVYTPAAVTVTNPVFQFVVLPERVQLALQGDDNPDAATTYFERILGGILDLLPHTPIPAVGLNFEYMLSMQDPGQLALATRKSFLCEANPLAAAFAADDARFGSYFSVNALGARLRLQVLPVAQEQEEFLRLSFNVQQEIKEAKEGREFLARWSEFHNYTAELARTLNSALEGA